MVAVSILAYMTRAHVWAGRAKGDILTFILPPQSRTSRMCPVDGASYDSRSHSKS